MMILNNLDIKLGNSEVARIYSGSNLAYGSGGGLLSEYGGAAAAYSLRSLTGNGGNVVNVRRSSDDAERDFTAQEVSDGTLVAWVGAGNDGFVETWYDQSGNGRHATQSTEASQPKIVDGGALVTENGNPCIERHQNNIWLDLSWISPSEVTTFYVAKLEDHSGGNRINPVLFGTNYDYTDGRNSPNTIGMNHGQGNELNFDLYFAGDKINQGIVSAIAIPGYGEIWQNGTKGVDGDFGPGGDGSPKSSYRLMQSTLFNHGIGNISEFIIYPSDQSANRAAIEANLAAQYGITLA